MKRTVNIGHKCRLYVVIHIFGTEQQFKKPTAAFENATGQ